MYHQPTAITVLGDGGWGTTLTIHLARLGHRVAWWGAFPAYLKTLERRRENVKFLPGIRIPRTIRITPDLADAVGAAQIIVLAVPSQYLRAVARRLARAPTGNAVFVSVAKGIEQGTLKRMSQVIAEELGPVPLAALSGPNIAVEIAQGHPASSVVASRNHRLAAMIQQLFTSDRLRL